MTMRFLTTLLAALAAASLLAGCGEEEPADNAVEAREGNTVELGAVRYRVVLFRELNVNVPPGDALWKGEPPAPGNGLYSVVLQACGTGGEPAPTSTEIELEDAFGQRFAPRPADTDDDFEYGATRLEPRECLPPPDSAAERTFDGAVLVFEVPFRSIDRPMVLEIADPGGGPPAWIQLDL